MATSEEFDPYIILGLLNGADATTDEIKKAYKSLALKLHPDKNRNNPAAAADFARLSTAYEALSDPKAKKAVDDLYRARAAAADRHKDRSEKRRKMMDDLEMKEKHEIKKQSEEQLAKQKLQAELNRLRQQLAQKAAASYEAQWAQRTADFGLGGHSTAPLPTPSPAPPSLTPAARNELARSLKVTWIKKDGDYTASELRQVFSAYGEVQDVVIKESKKKKVWALVVMNTLESAAAATAAVSGRMTNPLLVLPLSKVASVAEGAAALGVSDTSCAVSDDQRQRSGLFPAGHALQQARQQQQQQQQQHHEDATTQPTGFATFPAATYPTFSAATATTQHAPSSSPLPVHPTTFPAAASAAHDIPATNNATPSYSSLPTFPAPPFGSFSSFPVGAAATRSPVNRDFEDLTLRKLRQAAERARINEELKANDADGV